MTTNTEQLQILEKLFEEHFFCRTLRADFFYLSNHLRTFWEYFNSILTSHCTASVRHCVLFSLTLKKTRLAIYVYIWLPRNSACVLKHKQTWPEQTVYKKMFLWKVFLVLPELKKYFLKMWVEGSDTSKHKSWLIVICEISPKLCRNFVWFFLLCKLTYITEMLGKNWHSRYIFI